MATCIHPSRSCLPTFYTISIFPLLNRKIIHLLVSILSFFGCTLQYSEEYIALGYLLLFTYLLSLYRIVGIVLTYVYMQTLLQLLLWPSNRHFYLDSLPEATY